MSPIAQLKQWFENSVRFATWSDVETTVDDANCAEIRVSTNRFLYTIWAESSDDEGYLGCTCIERERQRGRDLPDGTFCEATWDEIIHAIVENEILSAPPPRGRGR